MTPDKRSWPDSEPSVLASALEPSQSMNGSLFGLGFDTPDKSAAAASPGQKGHLAMLNLY